MKLAKTDLIAALRLRYDYYSAQTMFDAARERAGLADQPAYEGAELARWRTALGAIGDRLANVEARLAVLLEGEPAHEAKPEKHEAKPEKHEAKPEKVETKAEPKPEKHETKAETKPEKHEPKTDGKTKAAPAIETTVALTGVVVGDGEQVMMCGGFGTLGDWDPERACPMAKKGDRWLATIKLAPDTDIAFKFLRRAADGTVVWENGGNRHLVPEPQIEATWRDD